MTHSYTAGPTNDTSDGEPEGKAHDRRFDSSANPLWTRYGKEAQGHERGLHSNSEKRTWMASLYSFVFFNPSNNRTWSCLCVVLQAGLFSAALTAFTIGQNLNPNPSDQMVYYLLTKTLPSSIRFPTKIASIAPQVPSLPLPPAPFPAFGLCHLTSASMYSGSWPSSSVSAVLLASLVQQWVRDYIARLPTVW